MNEKDRANVERLIELLKKRFPNLTAKETFNLVLDILEAVEF